MTGIANSGMFDQDSSQKHDEITFGVGANIRALTEYNYGSKPGVGPVRSHDGRTPMIQTWTLDADAGGHKYRVEHPVYSGKYLLGFADLIAFYRVRMTFERQPDFDPSRDDDKPHDRWGAYLVEVKTGSLKAGEAMRQIKAYEGALSHGSNRGAHYRGALKVPGEDYWVYLHMKSVLIVDNLPAQPVLEAFSNEDIIVYEAGPQYPNFFCF